MFLSNILINYIHHATIFPFHWALFQYLQQFSTQQVWVGGTDVYLCWAVIKWRMSAVRRQLVAASPVFFGTEYSSKASD